MLIYLPNIDRKAALLAGHEMGERPSMTASFADFGEAWPRVVAAMDVAADGTGRFTLRVTEPTPEALIVAVDHEERKAAETWATIVVEAERALIEYEAAMTAPLPPRRINIYNDTVYLGVIDGVDLPSISAPSRWDARHDRRDDPLFARLHDAKRRLEGRVSTENEIRRVDALPRLIQDHAIAETERAYKAAAEKATKEARISEQAAARLESGHWERSTSAYNERHYGKPWCAKVTGVDSRGKLIYEWAEWSGRIGGEGLLRVACKPSEIIACGQKNLRRPNRSDHEILQMREDGRMITISVPEAATALRAA